MYEKLTLQSNFGRPFVFNESLPFEISMVGCSNHQEIVDYIESQKMIASMFLKKKYDFPVLAPHQTLNYQSMEMVIKFAQEHDAIIVKLMMQF